jgi:predicted DNA-binding WGR domain protein
VRRWEYAEGNSSKFWEAATEGATVTVRYGRCGTEGRTQVKECASAEEAAEYLRKTSAAKERKGYQEVAAAVAVDGGDPPGPGADPAVEGDDTPAAEAPVVDEDTFVLPAAWHRHLHPRRGGVPRRPTPPRKGAAEQAERQLRDATTWVRQYLDSPRSDPDLVRAAEGHLAGTADPLGAAVLAVTSDTAWSGTTCADAWVEAHGPVFAARATVELFDIEVHFTQHGRHRLDPYVERTPDNAFAGHAWRVRAVADRLRARLAAADEDTYRAVVAALADLRSSARRRIVASYLVPSETAWVDECANGPEADRPRDHVLRSMLLCSLNDPEQTRQLGGVAALSYNGWSMPMVATVTEGIGTAVAPLVAEQLRSSYVTSDTVRKVNSVLVEFPSDEAFGLLLAQLDDKRTQPFVAKAARRYPRRALRMLAEAVAAGGPDADALRHALLVHVSAHPDLVEEALGSLSPGAAAAVEPLLSPRDRVPDAPAASLPDLFTDPPWTRRRTVAEVRTVRGLIAEDEPRIEWLPGERQEWADTPSWERDWARRSEWPDDPEALLSAVRADKVGSLGIFLDKPVDLVRPLLDEWDPRGVDSDAALKPVVARFGTEALDLVLRTAPKWPTALAPLLDPYVSVGAAGLVAEWAVRLKSARGATRSWFKRHGVAAAPLLVPDALGRAGSARRYAQQALRTIVALHGEAVVRAAAERYGAEAVAGIGELLAADPLVTALPRQLPEPVEWAEPSLLPQILLRSGGALPAESTRHVVTMLAMSRPGEAYLGLAVVRESCVPESLAAFGWALFEQWRLAGMPSRESWALTALGLFGDDGTVRGLTPLIRAWPGEGAHQRAVDGLGVLASIGTEVALMHLHGVAQRVKFKALKARAQEKIAELAEGLGLTGEQLADRLVPDLGLDARGTTVIDYGSRSFTVGFDEQLRPFVRDLDGKLRKDLPAPGAKDDAELAPAERKRFMALKKDVRTVAAAQVRRLESAMVEGRSWSAAEFRDLFVGHPLLTHLVRRLVWLSDSEGTTTSFRVAEDRTFADVADRTFHVPDTATVRIAHPLRLPDELDAWTELFADHDIRQPFPQLGRPVFELTPEEAVHWRLERFEGLTVTTGRLVGLERRGWRRGQPLDAGVERWISKRLAPHRYAVLTPDHGIAVGSFDPAEQQKVEYLWLGTRPTDYWPHDKHSARFDELDPVAVSELLADLTELTAP